MGRYATVSSCILSYDFRWDEVSFMNYQKLFVGALQNRNVGQLVELITTLGYYITLLPYSRSEITDINSEVNWFIILLEEKVSTTTLLQVSLPCDSGRLVIGISEDYHSWNLLISLNNLSPAIAQHAPLAFSFRIKHLRLGSWLTFPKCPTTNPIISQMSH